MKFKYGDIVDVVDGFFKGKKGVLLDFTGTKTYFSTGNVSYANCEYLIQFDDKEVWIIEKHLETTF